jgi:hypothetical protein
VLVPKCTSQNEIYQKRAAHRKNSHKWKPEPYKIHEGIFSRTQDHEVGLISCEAGGGKYWISDIEVKGGAVGRSLDCHYLWGWQKDCLQPSAM